MENSLLGDYNFNGALVAASEGGNEAGLARLSLFRGIGGHGLFDLEERVCTAGG